MLDVIGVSGSTGGGGGAGNTVIGASGTSYSGGAGGGGLVMGLRMEVLVEDLSIYFIRIL